MSDRRNAANTVGALVVGGLLSIGIGALLAVVEWPTDSPYDSGTEGSAAIAYIGLILIGLGQLAVFAAVVAWAVTIGIRWSGLTSDVDYIVRRAVGKKAGPEPGAPAVTRKRSGDLSDIAPLDPVRDRSYPDEGGR
jgi:hypothetical protein